MALCKPSDLSTILNNRESQGVNDEQRATAALKGIEGKRLTYRLPHKAFA
jgi:hypothetical protein